MFHQEDASRHRAQLDFIAAANSNKLAPSWVHNMALQNWQKQAAITAVDPLGRGSRSTAEGAYRLATALEK